MKIYNAYVANTKIFFRTHVKVKKNIHEFSYFNATLNNGLLLIMSCVYMQYMLRRLIDNHTCLNLCVPQN